MDYNLKGDALLLGQHCLENVSSCWLLFVCLFFSSFNDHYKNITVRSVSFQHGFEKRLKYSNTNIEWFSMKAIASLSN